MNLSRRTLKSAKRALLKILSVFMLGDLLAFKRQSAKAEARFPLRLRDLYPCLGDKTIETGFDRHYVFHTAWAARVVSELRPKLHVDIGSSLYFSSIASAFQPMEFYDYRPPRLNLSGLSVKEGDLMALPFEDDSVESLSCLHTLEHIGLGRYGDPIDPDGDLKAMRELCRALAPGGSLLLAVPMGKEPRIEFNAHRIYTYAQFLSYFPNMELAEFSYIPEREERGGLMRRASAADIKNDRYGCGCFHLRKKKQS